MNAGRPRVLKFVASHVHRHVQNKLPHPAFTDLSMQAGVEKANIEWGYGSSLPQHNNVDRKQFRMVSICLSVTSDQRLSKQALAHQGKIEPLPQNGGKTKCQAEDMHSHLRRQATQQLLQAHAAAWSAVCTRYSRMQRQEAVQAIWPATYADIRN